MHLTSRPDTPVACDMTTARDTPGERIAEYDELFERALLGRERRADSVVLAFRPDAREQVEDLARREYACCPFLDHAGTGLDGLNDRLAERGVTVVEPSAGRFELR